MELTINHVYFSGLQCRHARLVGIKTFSNLKTSTHTYVIDMIFERRENNVKISKVFSVSESRIRRFHLYRIVLSSANNR